MADSRHRRLDSPTGAFYVRVVADGPVETGWFAMLDHAGPASRNLEALGPEELHPVELGEQHEVEQTENQREPTDTKVHGPTDPTADRCS